MCQVCGCTSDLAEVSQVERVKASSRHLRGRISEELEQDTAAFSDESAQLLKFHGTYQQEDRDRRKEAKALGLPKYHMMMVRTRIPGGIVSADGYLAHDEIAERWGNQTMRVTTRQDFQLHGVLKGDLRQSIAAINATLLTTLGGCGDQERNIMCCPEPVKDRFHGEVLASIAGLVPALTPSTRAYHEIWLDGALHVSSEPEEERLYGDQYLPRKFKTGIALEGDNCIDVYANDLALVAMHDDDADHLSGFTVLVGGGLGRTNNKPDTYPAVARPMAWIRPEHVIELSQAVLTVQRDWGNRSDRRHARLKYLIAERGFDWFRERVRERVGFDLEPPRPLRWQPVSDHLGWHEQGDGMLYFGLYVENGRIVDTDSARLRTGLRRIVAELRPQVRLTAQQNVILADVAPDRRPRLDQLLAEHGIAPLREIHSAVRNSMACPARPTCGLAVAEAERSFPGLVRKLGAIMDELGIGDERISYRMTGCPNGCARPYLGDVGFVGTTLGKYDVFLGGDFEGTRLNTLFAGNVAFDELPGLLRALLSAYRDERQPGEGFGDWCYRVGASQLNERFLAAAAAS